MKKAVVLVMTALLLMSLAVVSYAADYQDGFEGLIVADERSYWFDETGNGNLYNGIPVGLYLVRLNAGGGNAYVQFEDPENIYRIDIDYYGSSEMLIYLSRYTDGSKVDFSYGDSWGDVSLFKVTVPEQSVPDTTNYLTESFNGIITATTSFISPFLTLGYGNLTIGSLLGISAIFLILVWVIRRIK